MALSNLIGQVNRLKYSTKTERIVRDLANASVLVFVATAVGAGILAAVSLSWTLGLGLVVSFFAMGVLFPLLCGWLWKERWRAKKLEEKLLNLQANSGPANVIAVFDDSTPAGLLIISSKLRVLFANQTYFRITHRGPEEVLGWGIHDVLVAEGVEDRARALLGHTDTAGSCRFTARICVGPVEERPVHITMTRIAPQQGEDRILVVLEEVPQDSVQSRKPMEDYVC